jgi:hypothetical protein
MFSPGRRVADDLDVCGYEIGWPSALNRGHRLRCLAYLPFQIPVHDATRGILEVIN